MNDAFRDDETLPRGQFHRASLEVDQQLPFEHIEEFVVVIVLVPVVFTLDHALSHYRVVHLAQGLVEPLVLAGMERAFSSMTCMAG
jgi:hypothetical protein